MEHVTVTINNKSYNLSCPQDQITYLNKCGDFINKKIKDVSLACKSNNETSLLVMTLFAITDEYFDQKSKTVSLLADKPLEKKEPYETITQQRDLIIKRLEKVSLLIDDVLEI